MPKFSIILPVRNGGAYVKECVNSILSQTLNDFDLLVLDNASTDGTAEWLNSLNDPRIKIYPSGKPLTIEENWARVVDIPTNEFITLIGHDDILYNHYLATMASLIEKHPNASLYQSHFNYINADGAVIRKCRAMDEVQYAHDFLSFSLQGMIDIMGTGFMMRAKDYKDVGGIPSCYPSLLFADFELWMNLIVKGYKATAFEECFAFRIHLSTTTTSADVNMQKALFIFIDYIKQLKLKDASLATVINRYGEGFIAKYCQSLAHRVLRTPVKKRNGATVKKLIMQSRQSVNDLLGYNNNFNPEKQFGVKLAIWIDSNFITRGLFLLFKKIYSRPVYQ